MKFKILSENNQEKTLKCFVDADVANYVIDRCSILRCCIKYFENAVAQRIMKQRNITVSSTEAEIVAISNVINDHLPIMNS